LQVFRSRRGIHRLELADEPFENRVEICGYGLGLGESRLQAGERVGEPGLVERLDEIVDRAVLEGLNRIVFVGSDEDDLGAPGNRPRRVESLDPGMWTSRNATLGRNASNSSIASRPLRASATISSSGQSRVR